MCSNMQLIPQNRFFRCVLRSDILARLAHLSQHSLNSNYKKEHTFPSLSLKSISRTKKQATSFGSEDDEEYEHLSSFL